MVRVEAELDPRLEAAEVARRSCARGGQALLMGRLTGHDLPAVVNLLATRRRICKAMGVESLHQVSERIQAVVDPTEPEGWFERVKTAPSRSLLGKLPPRVVKTAAVQQVVRLGGDVDLTRLPFLHSWPDEPGRAVTAGIFCSRDAEHGHRLVAHHQLEIIDRDRMAVLWDSHDKARRIVEDYRRRGRSMPVAIVLGGDPVGFLAAMAPLPDAADVWSFAGLLRQSPLDLVPCRSVDLQVPADAEIVIEGTINPDEDAVESGPWCMPGGYYASPCPAQIMRVSAITQRANPICAAIVLGPMADQPDGNETAPDEEAAPNEWVAITRAMTEVVLPLVRLSIPEMVDFDLPAAGSGRRIALVSIRKTYAGQARRVASAIWGLSAFMFSKLLVLVDEDVDIHNSAAVWARVSAMMDPGRDVFFSEGPPDYADPANPAATVRMAIDATRKIEGENDRQAKPAEMEEATRRAVDQRWREFGLGE